ncbi:MAG: LiaI-LiaF-like domain-containing protein [Candidatus Aminicenantes bacterium]
MAQRKRRDSLAWGIILIVIGLLFLLHNIDVDVWDSLARLWPVILIVWGVWKLWFGIKERREEAEEIKVKK